MAKIKILHIITRLDFGGSAENTVLSVEHVDAERYNSFVWTGPGLRGEGPPEEYQRRIGERMRVLPNLLRPIRPLRDTIGLFQLVNFLRREKPDILHLHSAKAGALGRVAAKLAGIRCKMIYTPHGHVFSGYGSGGVSRVFTWIEKCLAPWADRIVCLTEDERVEFLRHGAGVEEQFCVIPSGVDLAPYTDGDDRDDVRRDIFGVADDRPVVGFVGRFESVKGPDIFLEAANLIRQACPEVLFVMVGDGSMKANLLTSAERYGLMDSIRWLGWRDDIPRIMSGLDLFALTSRNEGQGRVLVEAMATELPIVAMNTGGVEYVVEQGVTGVLVQPGDTAALSEQVLALLERPEKRRTYGVAGRTRAEQQFSLQVMIARLEELYGELVAGK